MAATNTISPMSAYGAATLAFSRKMNHPPISGAQTAPNPLNDWAKLSRAAAVERSPSSVTYGFAEVSRKVNPHPITNSENKKNSNDIKCSPGMKSNAPMP